MTTVVKTRSQDSGKSNIQFTQPHLVLVEGADDQAIIAGLVREMKLEGFQIHDMGGKDDWRRKIALIAKSPDFKINVKSIGLMRDADANPSGAWDSCRFALSYAGLAEPPSPVSEGVGDPRTAVLIVPSSNEVGSIEDLCLSALDEQRKACVESYFRCLSRPDDKVSKKGLVQVYLGGLNEPVRDIVLAVAKNAINLDHESFNSAREFLRILSR